MVCEASSGPNEGQSHAEVEILTGKLSWAAMTLSIIGAFLVAVGMPFYGFVLWLPSNLLWLYISIKMKFWQQVFIWLVYTVTTGIGLVNWA